MTLSVFAMNDALLDRYEAFRAADPGTENPLTAIMLLDMTVKNGGVEAYWAFGPRGLPLVMEFAKTHGLAPLAELAQGVTQLQQEGLDPFGDLPATMRRQLQVWTDGYDAIADEVTRLLYAQYILS